jgi:predicted Abi (CAAX) family protease
LPLRYGELGWSCFQQRTMTIAPMSMNVQLQANFYLPIAAWTGRLILPVVEQRRKDGGVYLQV